jgi:branched-chain amino acid transport system permease protein
MSFPTYRGFMMGTAIVMLIAMHLLLARTRIGLVVRAALTHPSAVQALGHNVPRIFTLVFGVGCALAGLAGVVGGRAFVTEPSMAIAMGSVVFVVIVVGGLGSLSGALWASLAIGIVQTFAVALDHSLLGLLASAGLAPPAGFFHSLLGITIAQMAPVLPYFLMVAVLLLRPAGMAGNRTAG